jgi:hypothetical protein
MGLERLANNEGGIHYAVYTIHYIKNVYENLKFQSGFCTNEILSKGLAWSLIQSIYIPYLYEVPVLIRISSLKRAAKNGALVSRFFS